MGLFDIFGDGEEAQPPAIIPTPKRKTPQELADEALSAARSTYGGFFDINRDILPRAADLYTDIQTRQAPRLFESYIQNERTGRPQLLDIAMAGLKQIDPTGFVISEELKNRVLTNLRAGGGMTREETDAFDQGIQSRLLRQGRGTGVGDAYSAEKLFANERFDREQTRINNAMAIQDNPQSRLAMGVNVPYFNANGMDPFVTRAPTAASLFDAAQGQNQGQINDVNNLNSLRLNQAEFAKRYASPDPFSTFAGMAAGIGTQLGGAALSNPALFAA